MKKIVTSIIIAVSSIATALAQSATYVPGQTSSQVTVNGGALLNFLALLQTIVSRLVPFAVGVAVIAFFWFLIRFIWQGAEDGEARGESLKGMGWSIIALFVMVSIWGLVGFLGSVTGIGQGGGVPIPGVPTGTPAATVVQ
ncbi:MAG: hypothetical protein KBC21_03220 [Candidatus Pacebacteria bacterium]|nr:hypothetical protein [Candidatus Paceibacterota bacterium]